MKNQWQITEVAPWAGVEPATFRLTVERSTAELPGNAAIVDSGGAITKGYRRCKNKAPFRKFAKKSEVEATPGIEPGYADLQSAASPLRHVAPAPLYRTCCRSTTRRRRARLLAF